MSTQDITLEEVVAIHDRAIEVGGGRAGIRDFFLLHSAVERPKASFAGRSLYPTIYLKVAALLHSLIRNHPFEDGNKRTALFSAMRFLAKNGYQLSAPEKELVEFTLKVDTQKLDVEQIADWLKKHSKRHLGF